MIVIDQGKAIELLDKAVEFKGEDYIDPMSYDSMSQCYYVTGNEHCIVGQVLSFAGVSDEQLDQINERGSIVSAYQQVKTWQTIEITSAAISILAYAQDEQDGGASWGTARERALERFNKFGHSTLRQREV